MLSLVFQKKIISNFEKHFINNFSDISVNIVIKISTIWRLQGEGGQNYNQNHPKTSVD